MFRALRISSRIARVTATRTATLRAGAALSTSLGATAPRAMRRSLSTSVALKAAPAAPTGSASGSGSGSGELKFFLLQYDYIPDILEKRPAHRAAHLEKAKAALARGELVLGGAFNPPKDGAVLLFRAADKSVVESFAKADPYVINKLVTAWRVKEWTVVIGQDRI